MSRHLGVQGVELALRALGGVKWTRGEIGAVVRDGEGERAQWLFGPAINLILCALFVAVCAIILWSMGPQ